MHTALPPLHTPLHVNSSGSAEAPHPQRKRKKKGKSSQSQRCDSTFVLILQDRTPCRKLLPSLNRSSPHHPPRRRSEAPPASWMSLLRQFLPSYPEVKPSWSRRSSSGFRSMSGLLFDEGGEQLERSPAPSGRRSPPRPASPAAREDPGAAREQEAGGGNAGGLQAEQDLQVLEVQHSAFL